MKIFLSTYFQDKSRDFVKLPPFVFPHQWTGLNYGQFFCLQYTRNNIKYSTFLPNAPFSTSFDNLVGLDQFSGYLDFMTPRGGGHLHFLRDGA